METILNLNDSTIDGLKKIARMNHDASEGFKDAAERLDHNRIESVFRDARDQRQQFANEIRTAISINEEDAPDGGTALGAFHRCWLNVRGAINGGDTEVILTEASRGEDALISEYEDVLVETAGSPLNATLHQQLTSNRRTRDSIEAMRQTES